MVDILLIYGVVEFGEPAQARRYLGQYRIDTEYMRNAEGRSVGRGQAIQLGALLLFAILIINLSLFQVFIVPNQNGEIEFKHSQQVQEELETARSLAQQAVATDTELSTAIQLGPQYPSRTLFVNPAPPAGTVETVDRGDIVVTNAEPAASETAQAWDETGEAFPTKGLAYRPGYNYYDNAPTTVYGASVLYNVQPDGTVRSRTGQTLVSGNRISLVAMSGSMGTSASGAETIEFQPASAPTQRVPIEPTGSGDFTVALETQIPENVWQDLLASEIDGSDSDPNAYIESIDCSASDPDDPCGTLTLTFEDSGDETYSLRLGEVGVGDNVDDEPESYITRVDPTTASLSVTEGNQREITVEVRDRYNNPVSGVAVTVTDPAGAGTVTATEDSTDERGRASFVYEGSSTGTEDVEFAIPDDSFQGPGSTSGLDDAEKVVYSATVNPVAGSGPGSGDGGSGSTDYGTGGTSRYANDSTTTTVSVDNGRYTGIYSTDELILSGGIPTVDTNNGKKRLEYETALDNGTTTYTVRLRLIKGLSAEDWNTRSVKIFDDSGNSQSATLTKEAAAAINGSRTAYEGTDLLDVNDVAYEDPGSSFERLAAEVRAMDDDGDTTVTALTTTIEGRVNATIRQEALFSAAQPQPSDGAQYQFVRFNFETPTNTTGWEIRYEEGSGTTTLPTRANVGDLSGEIYFAADESAFETQRGLADDVVYPLETSLQDADNLTLVDSSGDRRDELAFEADTDGTPSTTNGWTVSDLGSGEVAVRKTIGDPYRDADNVSDWRITTQTSFFGASGPSVAFVPNSNQGLIRTVTPSGTVVDYGADPNEIKILGPKTDLDDDGQDEVLYIGGNDGDELRYKEADNTTETLVDKKVRQSSAIGVGDPDGDGLKTVYYAVSNGNKLKKIEVGGNSERVSPGSGNSKVSAKGAVGYADANDDGDDDIIYLPSGTSKEIGYVDDGSTTTTRIGPPGNRYQIGNGNAVGEPVEINGNLRVPIVNGSQDLLLVDPADGSNFETVNRGSVKPKKNPITVLDWRGDDTKEILVINGNDNQHLYYVEVNTGDETETGEVRDEQADQKGVR